MRHEENLAGLRKTADYHTGRIDLLDAELVTLRDNQSHLSAKASAAEVYAVKSAVLAAEANRGAAAEELDLVLPQIAEEQSRAKATAKQLAKARAGVP